MGICWIGDNVSLHRLCCFLWELQRAVWQVAVEFNAKSQHIPVIPSAHSFLSHWVWASLLLPLLHLATAGRAGQKCLTCWLDHRSSPDAAIFTPSFLSSSSSFPGRKGKCRYKLLISGHKTTLPCLGAGESISAMDKQGGQMPLYNPYFSFSLCTSQVTIGQGLQRGLIKCCLHVGLWCAEAALVVQFQILELDSQHSASLNPLSGINPTGPVPLDSNSNRKLNSF